MPIKPQITSAQIVRNAKKLNIDFEGTVWFDEIKLELKDDENSKDLYPLSFANELEPLFQSGVIFGNLKHTLDPDFDSEN
jgi:hypothetical protein